METTLTNLCCCWNHELFPMPSRNPSTWDEYERGASPQRSVSIDSNAVAEDQSLLGEDDEGDYGSSSHGLRRRRLLFLTQAE